MNMACELRNVIQGGSENQADRADFANRIYCEVCQENGVKICSLENFTAWKDYLEGKIGESEFEVRAKEELSSFSKVFQKYTVVAEDKSPTEREEEKRREKAGRAANIYKSACREHGLSECFFNNFLAWSRYIEGSMTESEFSELVNKEAGELSKV